jgi:[acyl-carrier-protein] S-malonyltransferase
MGLGLLFPGQGSQGAGLFEGWVASAEAIIAALAGVIGEDPRTLSLEAMHRNATAQPVIVAHELALLSILRPVLPEPILVLGYCVGEIAACAAAGMLDAEAAVALAARRAALMDAYAPVESGMLAVRGPSVEHIARIAEETGTEIAIENGPDHAVLGGTLARLDLAAEAALAAGARVALRLPVSISSHVGDLRAAAGPFRQDLKAALVRDPAVTFISGVSASPLRARTAVVDDLAHQIHTRPRFADSLEMARAWGATCFLEVGPGQGLTRIVSDLMPDMPARAVDAFRSAAGVAARRAASSAATRGAALAAAGVSKGQNPRAPH